MIDPNKIQAQNQELCQLAGEKFSFKAKTLQKAMHKIGRRLPKRVHQQADVLIKAETLSGHPKLSRMLDADAARKAHEALRAALDEIDPKDRRKGAILGVLGTLSFNLFTVVGLIVVVLLWRGFM